MRTEKDLAAIILSAGFSSRMAAFKPLLPMGNSTVIETVINIFLQAGISDITVVLGYRADDLKPLLGCSHVRWILNERYNEGMYSLVASGDSGLYPAKVDIKGFFCFPRNQHFDMSDLDEKIFAIPGVIDFRGSTDNL